MATATQLEAEPGTEAGVWWLDLGGVNAYLADDDGDLVLVDAGTPRDAADLRDGIREAGYRVSDVARVLVTHYDVDHVGGLSKLGLDAPVYVGRADAEILAGQRKPSARNHKGLLQRVTNPLVSVPDLSIRPVEDGDEIGSFTAYHTPGHSPGHTVYVADSPSVAFLGDLVREADGRLEASPWVTSYDTDEVARSIRQLADDAPDFEMAAMGHGTPIMRRGSERLRELADRL
ncbi:MBL fold metallo-hydrolase [Halorussus gelatinilyticus]|uniref:MBL fold metallo-hydrolase n=1 Tax=Halorussus gelatinilyticus TaxID=2937524 RepID=A0A8U0ILE3_9EURY|nr:MBL fold metallo-hydrolase [Halorussus gelatinilyticus]UPW01152.1 MBL fold metallo-hydrolase [Halorussus gelatinilyticus]